MIIKRNGVCCRRARLSQDSTRQHILLPAGCFSRPGHTAGLNPPPSSGLSEATGLEKVKEGGFGLTPSPAIPSSVSGDTSPVPGMLSGGHAQKLLRAGKEQMGKDATSNTGVWPAAASPASPGPQLCPPTELQRTGNNTKPLS